MSHYAVHAPFNLDVRFAEKYKNSGKSKKAQAFATLIEGVDKSLGDIVQHVKDLGLGENTLILFLGDNGSDAPLPKENNYSSSSPLKGKKGTSWEGGMRVPFIASWIVPNKKAINQQKTPIAKNAVQLQMGTILDIFPTLCNVAEVNNTNDIVLDGFNLEKQFLGQKNINRDEVFVNHFPHHHNTSYYTSLVKSNWKVIYYYPVNGTSTYELFNLKKDPFETTNLASKNPKQLKFMMELLVSELKDKNALYPEINNTLLQPIIPN